MSALNFDATQHDPNVGFEPIPAGDYVAMVIESEVRATQAGTGSGLNLTWEILDGPYKGRRLWQWLNINNPSKQAEEIGQRELSNVCHAVGKLRVADSAELHNTPCTVKVKFTPAGKDRKGVYRDARNEITSCQALDGAAPPQQAVQLTAATGRCSADRPADRPAARRGRRR